MTSANPILRSASVRLERAGKKAPIWNEAARLASATGRDRVEVNIQRISRLFEDGATLFVPGKVLGSGLVDKKLVVGAFSFSQAAKAKIESAGGSALTIEEFVKKYPTGKGVRLVK
jgi:large subunit ribosomal protein L18e